MYKPTKKDLMSFIQLNRPCIGSTTRDLLRLSEGGHTCVIIDSDEELNLPDDYYVIRAGGLNRIDRLTGRITEKMPVKNYIFKKPGNYVKYVEESLVDLLEFPDEEVLIDTFGNKLSERAGIHNAASNLGLGVVCNFSGGENVFRVKVNAGKTAEHKFPWWNSLSSTFLEVEFTGVFSSFRAKVYRMAKLENVAVTVKRLGNNALVKLKSETRDKSLMQRFNEFLDSIPVGESRAVPDEFKNDSTQYLRVLCSNHSYDLSFTRGTINHHTPAPRIDHHGNFIINGKNYGRRSDQYIELKLRNTEYTLEDIKK